MHVTRRNLLAAAPAGAALAALPPLDRTNAGDRPLSDAAPSASAEQTGWLVALRSGLARRAVP